LKLVSDTVHSVSDGLLKEEAEVQRLEEHINTASDSLRKIAREIEEIDREYAVKKEVN
jgi:hypothetical protein